MTMHTQNSIFDQSNIMKIGHFYLLTLYHVCIFCYLRFLLVVISFEMNRKAKYIEHHCGILHHLHSIPIYKIYTLKIWLMSVSFSNSTIYFAIFGGHLLSKHSFKWAWIFISNENNYYFVTGFWYFGTLNLQYYKNYHSLI